MTPRHRIRYKYHHTLTSSTHNCVHLNFNLQYIRTISIISHSTSIKKVRLRHSFFVQRVSSSTTLCPTKSKQYKPCEEARRRTLEETSHRFYIIILSALPTVNQHQPTCQTKPSRLCLHYFQTYAPIWDEDDTTSLSLLVPQRSG